MRSIIFAIQVAVVVGSVVAHVAPVHAEEVKGRTTCGAYRMTIYPARGPNDPGSINGSLCDDKITFSGTPAKVTSVTFRSGQRNLSMKAKVGPPGKDRASVEAFVKKIDALKEVVTVLNVADPKLVDKVFDTATTLLEEAHGLNAGRDVGCSDVTDIIATAGAAVYLDQESSIVYREYYVPPHCTVVTSGTVNVDKLIVDGILIRIAGPIKAKTIEGGVGTGVGLGFGRIIVAGPPIPDNMVRDIVQGAATNAGLPTVLGSPIVIVDDLKLDGLKLTAAGVEAKRITVANKGGLSADVLVRADSISTSTDGGVSARVVEFATLETRSKSTVSGSDYLGPKRGVAPGSAGGGATIVASGSSSISGGIIRATSIDARDSGKVSGTTLDVPTVTATSGGRITIGERLTAKTVTLTDNARMSGKDAFIETLTSTKSSTTLSVLEAKSVTGTDAGIVIRQQLRGFANGRFASTTPADGTVKLTGGSLIVSAYAVDRADPATPANTPDANEAEGEPGFDKCLALIPGIDLALLDVKNTEVAVRHAKIGTFKMKGGRYRPINRSGVRDVPRATMCLEVKGEADIDGTFVAASRLYGRFGTGRVSAASEFTADEGGDLPREGRRKLFNETIPDLTGASFGGYGGSFGNLGGSNFWTSQPTVDNARTFREGGIGGMGSDKTGIDNGHRTGFPGAGVIRIEAKDFTFDGKMHADGRTFPDGIDGGGGGSGGTVVIAVTDNIAGRGSISANGGDGGFEKVRNGTGGGGSGGRIRVEFNNKANWRGTITSYGGLGGRHKKEWITGVVRAPWHDWRNHGGPGTIYWKHHDGTAGQIIVAGPPLVDGKHRGVGFLSGDYAGEEIVIENAFVVSDKLVARGLTIKANGVLTGDEPRLRLEWPPVRGTGYDTGPYPPTLSNSLEQTNYPDDIWSEPIEEKLVIDLSGDLTIERNGRLDLTGLGKYGQASNLGTDAFHNRAGGSHGGIGGLGRFSQRPNVGAPTASYGDAFEPNDFGEGGFGDQAFKPTFHHIGSLGGAGGGIARVTVAGTTIVDGKLASDGARGAPFYSHYTYEVGTGAGAGGSVWLTTKALAGTGTISANGGDGTASPKSGAFGGGGGGGRVRIDVTDKARWRGKAQAFGGLGGRTDASTPKGDGKEVYKSSAPFTDVRYDGGPGTIYWREANKPTLLVIDGSGGGKGVGRIGGVLPADKFAKVSLTKARVMADNLTVEELALTGSMITVNDPRVQALALDGQTHPFDPMTLPKKAATTALSITATKLSIDRASRIDLTGLGNYGETACVKSCQYTNRAGGSHGGKGGVGNDNVVGNTGEASPASGNAADPTTPGQGGWGTIAATGNVLGYDACRMGGGGGGALQLKVTTTLELAGKIIADGASAPTKAKCDAQQAAGGGGAGGSIAIEAARITGAGTLSARGGTGSARVPAKAAEHGVGGGGGGGRVRVNGTCAFTGKIAVDGGGNEASAPVRKDQYRGEKGSIAGTCRR